MKKYKIVKEIHTYKHDEIKFRIHERFLWKWIICESFSEFKTYKSAEKSIIEELNRCEKLGGIIEIDNNVYKFFPYSLPLP